MKKIKIKNPYREELKKVPPVPPLSELLHQRFQATVNTKILPFRSQRVCILFRYFVDFHESLKGLGAWGEYSGFTIFYPDVVILTTSIAPALSKIIHKEEV